MSCLSADLGWRSLSGERARRSNGELGSAQLLGRVDEDDDTVFVRAHTEGGKGEGLVCGCWVGL